MKENYIIKMINSKNILNEKFINYFNALDYKEDEKILTLFLNAMLDLSEEIYCEQEDIKGPGKIIKEIEVKFGIKNNWQILIEQIINSDDIKKLTELELFATLWWFSCKNILLFEQSYYYTQAQKGNIGKILAEFYARILNFKDVFITKIEIENFRNIKNMCVDIDKSIVLIQAKDVHATNMYSLGKTNFLNAILWCFCKNKKRGEIDANIDILNEFKNKKISEFNTSVKITLKDESGQTYQAQRIITYSYQKKSDNSLEIEDYYTTQELFFNEKAYNFGDFLDKTKDFILPNFVDDIDIYKFTNLKEKIKEYIDQAKDKQIFITSYDNHSSEPIVQNILNELKKDYQIITVNK